MGHNVPHGLNLAPGNGRVLGAELLGELANQFADLKDAECSGIPVNRI